MSAPHISSDTFLSLEDAANRLGVPVGWLRAEAKTNRFPTLRVGRRLVVQKQTVDRVLLERVQEAGGWGSP